MNRDYSEMKDYADKVSVPYKLGGMPEVYPQERFPYASMAASKPVDLTALDTIEQSLIRAIENSAAIEIGLTALQARIHGPRPEAANKDFDCSERADGTLNRVYQCLTALHEMIDRIDRVKNELINLA